MEYLKFGGKKNLDELVKKSSGERNITEAMDESEIKIGDKIISRYTAKEGVVTGTHIDGRTIEVDFTDSGKMNISKESVYKMKGDKISKINNGENPYGDVKKIDNKDIEDIKQEEVNFETPKDKKYTIRDNSIKEDTIAEHDKQKPGKEVKVV